MPDFTYNKEEIIELITNVLVSQTSDDLERESVEQELLDECQTPEELAEKYNKTVNDEDVCKVANEQSWTFEFEENFDD